MRAGLSSAMAAFVTVAALALASLSCVSQSAPTSPGGPGPPPATLAPPPTQAVSPPSPTSIGARGAPSPRTYAVDPTTATNLQAELDGGRQPWRLDPVQVARMTLEGEGVDLSQASFSQTELAPEPGTRRPRVLVRVSTPAASYEVELVQPVRQGLTGIWMATALRAAA